MHAILRNKTILTILTIALVCATIFFGKFLFDKIIRTKQINAALDAVEMKSDKK